VHMPRATECSVNMVYFLRNGRSFLEESSPYYFISLRYRRGAKFRPCVCTQTSHIEIIDKVSWTVGSLICCNFLFLLVFGAVQRAQRRSGTSETP
jgi:hypothetical protein